MSDILRILRYTCDKYKIQLNFEKKNMNCKPTFNRNDFFLAIYLKECFVATKFRNQVFLHIVSVIYIQQRLVKGEKYSRRWGSCEPFEKFLQENKFGLQYWSFKSTYNTFFYIVWILLFRGKMHLFLIFRFSIK